LKLSSGGVAGFWNSSLQSDFISITAGKEYGASAPFTFPEDLNIKQFFTLSVKQKGNYKLRMTNYESTANGLFCLLFVIAVKIAIINGNRKSKGVFMEKKEIFELLNSNPIFYLATNEGTQPRVRAMMLYKADDNGVAFHTSAIRDLYAQIQSNPNVEMCFFDAQKGIQVRVSGKLEEIANTKYKDEILEHPSREFLRTMKEQGAFKNFYEDIKVFSLKNGTAVIWTFASNFDPKEKIAL